MPSTPCHQLCHLFQMTALKRLPNHPSHPPTAFWAESCARQVFLSLLLQAASLHQHYRGFRKELGDASALDVVTETHVDSQCGKETLLTFVYISADAVRNNEDVLKPHCRYMRMSGMDRGRIFSILTLCLHFTSAFFFFLMSPMSGPT